MAADYQVELHIVASLSPLPIRVTVEEVSIAGLRIAAQEALEPGFYTLTLIGSKQLVTYELRWCRKSAEGWQCGLEAVDDDRRSLVAKVRGKAKRRRIMRYALAICVLAVVQLLAYALG